MPEFIELNFDDDIGAALENNKISVETAMLTQIQRDVHQRLLSDHESSEVQGDKLQELIDAVKESKKNEETQEDWFRVSIRKN